MRRRRLCGHRALRIQQMFVARPQPQADQSARVRYGLRLPAVVSLVAPHGIFAGLIPSTGRFAGHVMRAYQRFLDRLSPLGIDFLLASRGLPFAVLARTRILRFAIVGCPGRARLWMLTRRRMRCRMRLHLRFGWGFGIGTAACLRGGSRRLPQRRARRSTGTHQSQRATCAQPSSCSCAMRRFQRQPQKQPQKISGQCLAASKTLHTILPHSLTTDH